MQWLYMHATRLVSSHQVVTVLPKRNDNLCSLQVQCWCRGVLARLSETAVTAHYATNSPIALPKLLRVFLLCFFWSSCRLFTAALQPAAAACSSNSGMLFSDHHSSNSVAGSLTSPHMVCSKVLQQSACHLSDEGRPRWRGAAGAGLVIPRHWRSR